MTQNCWITDSQITFYGFPPTKFEAIYMLETFMEELACEGLCVNAGKTVVLTCFDQRSSATEIFGFDESRSNCRERQRCRAQMVGVYSVSWRR